MKEVKKQVAEHHANHVHKIKSMATGPAIPRAKGGSVHSDLKEDRSLVKKMVKPTALTGRKAGGSASGKKPRTQVNVLVGRGQQPPPSPGGAAPAPVPLPPRAAPPPGPIPPPAGGLAALRGVPPGAPMAKRGGKVGAKHRASGGATRSSVPWQHAGAGTGEGRLEKERAYGVKSPTKSRNSR